MGGCMSNNKTIRVKPTNSSSARIATTSARNTLSRVNSLAMKDVKGFRKSESSITNFYDILDTIGRGNTSLFYTLLHKSIIRFIR